jgi:hypothetical protein
MYVKIISTICTLGHTLLRSGWVTALQTGKSRVRFPMVSLDFFIDIIRSTQPVTELGARTISLGGGGG